MQHPGLRVGLSGARLRGQPALRCRQHVVCDGLRTLFDLHDVCGGQVRLHGLLGDGGHGLQQLRGRQFLVRCWRDFMHTLHVVHCGQLRIDCVLDVVQHCVLGMHGWYKLVSCGRLDLHELHRVPVGHLQERRKLHDDDGPDVHQLRGWPVLGRAGRHFVHGLSDGRGLSGLYDDGQEHVRLRRGLRVECYEKHVRRLRGWRELVLRGRFFVHGLYDVRGRHFQERLVLLDCGHNDLHKLRGGLVLELDQRGLVLTVPDGHGLPGLHGDGQEHMRLRRGLRVERQRVRRLHSRQHLVGRVCNGVHHLHDVPGWHFQGRLVHRDRGRDDVHELHSRPVLELDQRSLVHGLPDGHGLPGLDDDGQEHVRLRRGLRMERYE